MIVSIEINDNKARVFLEFLKNLDFVKIQKTELDEGEYLNLLNERLEEYNINPKETKELNKALAELKDKYGF